MRLFLGLLTIIVIVGLALALGLPQSGSSHASYIDARSAADKAAEEVSLNYWNQEAPEEARCPRHVLAEKGRTFWCQVLLQESLVPVEMELASPLGFFRVVKVGRNQALLEQGEIEREAVERQKALAPILAECEILISISRSQERHEEDCDAEAEAKFANGDTSPPALRAGRFH